MRRLGAVACAVALVLSVGCERETPRAETPEPEPEVVRRATPTERAVMERARGAMIKSWRGGAVAALARVRKDAAIAAAKRTLSPPSDEAARRATIVFSANNRGEREDCGCKRNPLGGLARRGTLLDLAKAGGESSAERWGRIGGDRAERLFYVDAGDALFKNTRTHTEPEAAITEHMKKARAVIAGMNALEPDAVVVGTYDLSAGWDRFDALREAATFPFVSANLRVKGAPALPSHVVVRRGGLDVAFVGITAPRGATSDFYEKVGVEVADSVTSYADAVREAGEVDALVLLSNAGVTGTKELIEDFEAAGLRVDAAIVSGSGARTSRPNWTSGVPTVEPNARGKYVGRADLWIVGEGPLSYANDTPDVTAAVQRYTRALEGYSSNRTKMLLKQAEIHEASEAEADVKKLERELEFARKRMGIVGEELAISASRMSPGALESSGEGDDWFESAIVPVKIDIEEKRAVKRAVDVASK